MGFIARLLLEQLFFFSPLVVTGAALSAWRPPLRRLGAAPPPAPATALFFAFALAVVAARVPLPLLLQSGGAAVLAAAGLAAHACCGRARATGAPDVFLAGAAGLTAGLLTTHVLLHGGVEGGATILVLGVYLVVQYGVARATCLSAAPDARTSEDGAIRAMMLVTHFTIVASEGSPVLNVVALAQVTLCVLVAPHLVRGVVHDALAATLTIEADSLAQARALLAAMPDLSVRVRYMAALGLRPDGTPTFAHKAAYRCIAYGARHVPAVLCGFLSGLVTRLTLALLHDIETQYKAADSLALFVYAAVYCSFPFGVGIAVGLCCVVSYAAKKVWGLARARARALEAKSLQGAERRSA